MYFLFFVAASLLPSDIYKAVLPSVVVVTASSESDASFENSLPPGTDAFFSNPIEKPGSVGSGFCFSPGFVVTCRHVVYGSTSVEVTYYDGSSGQAAIVATDEPSDLAVLKIDKELPPLTFSDEPPTVGCRVYSIGAPMRMPWTFGEGIVTFSGRALRNGRYSQRFLQTNLPLAPGSSGSPLFDEDGRIAGINSLTNWAARGVSFAIPCKTLKKILGVLKDGEVFRHPWLGIDTSRDLTVKDPGKNDTLRSGDKIVKFNGVPVSSQDDVRDMVAEMTPGDPLTISVIRGMVEVPVNIKVGEMASP